MDIDTAKKIANAYSFSDSIKLDPPPIECEMFWDSLNTLVDHALEESRQKRKEQYQTEMAIWGRIVDDITVEEMIERGEI